MTQSNSYLTGNAGGLRQDWPRIPLPASHEALWASAALLNTESPVPGVTSGTIYSELKTIAVISRMGDGRDPGSHRHGPPSRSAGAAATQAR